MPSFNHPAADADELREAARGLAHATRQIDDPSAIYSVIGSISLALGSLSQALHQLGAAHDRMSDGATSEPVGRTARASAFQVSWEMHRAAEMLTQVGATVDRAHQLEAAITYDVHLPVMPVRARRASGPTPGATSGPAL